MKTKSFLCVLFVMLSISAVGQAADQNGSKSGDIPDPIEGTFDYMGIPQAKREAVFHSLEKACGQIHDALHVPHNAYAVKVHECYVVLGRVIQQVSKSQALIVQMNLLGQDTGNYFLGNFGEFSESVKDGELQKLDYSPAENDMIVAIGSGLDPTTYNATDGTTKTVPSYAIMLYVDKGQQ